MSELSYEQRSYLHQFLHPEKLQPTLDEATIAGTLGTPIEIYRQIKDELMAITRKAAEELLSDPDFAARVDRLPFTSGSKIVGLGDSITDDWNSWLEILRSLLSIRRPEDNIQVINSGVSGDTTTHLIFRFSGTVAVNPDWIICMIGTNDTIRAGEKALDVLISAKETEKNLALLRNYAATQTSAQWVWITPYAVLPDKNASHWFLPALQFHFSNDALKTVVEMIRRQKDPVVDLHKVLGSAPDPKYLLEDGLHLSLAGQTAIVRALVELLT